MPKKKLLNYSLITIFAVLVPILSLLITLLLTSSLGATTPYLIFFPAIILSAWYGGLYAGIVTSLISILEIDYFFLMPYQSLLIGHIVPVIQSLLFVIEGFFVSFFIDKGKRHSSVTIHRKKEKEYLETIANLEQNYQIAQEAIQSRDEFLSIASHELKTPLTSMLLQIQTALHNIRSVSLAQFSVEHLLKMLESAENQTKRLSRMINDLLNVSLITTGKMDLELEEVDLSELVKEVVNDFEEKIKKENYIVKVIVDTPIIGQWDKVRIEQALSNLISNAIKYGKGKPILVTVSKQNNLGKIIVKDEGIGIPHKDQNRVFALFQRAVSGNDYKGLGVGLYITYQIIKAHGGTISLQSNEGKGATFTIELPLEKQAEEEKLLHF